MFYLTNPSDPVLRLGDILKGFFSVVPSLKQPILSIDDELSYNLDITLPEHTVVITPCCSIGPSVICLTPLIELRADFFKNPYFTRDFININRKMNPNDKVSSEEWDTMLPKKKMKLVNQGYSYALLNFFIYEKNNYFTEYTKRSITTKYYMIDFKKMFYVKCQHIQRNGKITDAIKKAKILQLTIEARKELREKLSHYYLRKPSEDSTEAVCSI